MTSDKPTCPYCGQPGKCVDSKVIYGRSYGPAWVCANYPTCDSYVGCHPGSKRPLGRMANAELRAAKKRAHAAFDPLWRSKTMSRSDAYYWLAKAIGIHVTEAHIGMFGVAQCEATVKACREFQAATP